MAAAVVASVLGVNTADAQPRKIYNFGTGGIGGTFYPMGGFVCDLLNKSRKTEKHSYRCTVESTAGTVGNLRGIHRGDLDMGLSQADMFFHAYHGLKPFDKPFSELRFLMAFTTNSVTVVARKDSGIKHVRDLKGKRVNTGAVGSGTEAISNVVMGMYGWDPKKDFLLNSKLGNRELARGLCDNKFDAYIWAAGLGTAGIVETLTTCDARLVTITGPEVDKIVKERAYYVKTVIPAGVYPGQTEGVHTFGYSTCLVTTPDLPEDLAYYLVKAVFGNFEHFKKQHPGFKYMTREVSVKGCKADIPVHPGALRYLKEAGLIK
jgi:hypothetical protein